MTPDESKLIDILGVDGFVALENVVLQWIRIATDDYKEDWEHYLERYKDDGK